MISDVSDPTNGTAIINVDDIDVSVREVREAHKMGLFGGVLLPTSTGQ